MKFTSRSTATGMDYRLTVAVVIGLALVILVITWVGIREKRSDSLELLVTQGKSFTEALAQAAENAIESENVYDFLVHQRFSEIVTEVATIPDAELSDQRLTRIALDHQLHGVYVFDSTGEPMAAGVVRGALVSPPQFVIDEMKNLLANPEAKFLLLLDPRDSPMEAIHYHLELSNDLDKVILVVADAVYYMNALQQTQIGYLAQNMAREPGVNYIVYQSTEGIIFSSKRVADMVAIEADSFLTRALEADTISHRVHDAGEEKVLELLRPFSTSDYQFGLLRVGLSLERYYDVSRAFDRQMIALAALLFALVAAVLLYARSRRQRRAINLQYQQMKSVTDKILDEMRTGVAVVSTDGHVTLANEAFERIFAVRDSVGRQWDEVVKHERLTFDDIRSYEQTAGELELPLQTPGQSKTILVALSHIEESEAAPSGTVVVVYDITRLKEFETRSARRERLSELGNLAAGVAHEIRNPLNTISIASQRLASEFSATENDEEFRAFTKQIREETRRLNEIITRFLALAREEQRRESVIELRTLLDDITNFLRVEADQLGIDVTVECEEQLSVAADPDALKQVFTNLFNNAKEAVADGSGQIRLSCRRVDDRAEIRFCDNGPGIDPAIGDKIFTPYFTTKEGGTGLGLPAVHRIVTESGGEVTYEPAPSGGACFVITLPLKGE